MAVTGKGKQLASDAPGGSGSGSAGKRRTDRGDAFKAAAKRRRRTGVLQFFDDAAVDDDDYEEEDDPESEEDFDDHEDGTYGSAPISSDADQGSVASSARARIDGLGV